MKKEQSTKGPGNHRVRIRAQRRNPPDLPKLSRALIELATAQAEADAESDHQTKPPGQNNRPESGGRS